jgi:uncharacterized protein YeaO (DUF488 family)
MAITLRRAYLPAERGDGKRFLVERLWPRGVRKEALQLDAWLKDVAPSTELRRWFSHDPARWDEFRRRYWRELDEHPAAWAPLIDAARHSGITLVYSSHDEEHNNAVALKEYLDLRLGRQRSAGAHRHRSAA